MPTQPERPADLDRLTNEEVAGRLRIAVNRLQRRLRQQSLGGLSPGQASALGTVHRHGNPTLGELAALEQVQPPTMTRIVANLADAGMVTREADPTTRRRAQRGPPPARGPPPGPHAPPKDPLPPAPPGRARAREAAARRRAGGAARAPA